MEYLLEFPYLIALNVEHFQCFVDVYSLYLVGFLDFADLLPFGLVDFVEVANFHFDYLYLVEHFEWCSI